MYITRNNTAINGDLVYTGKVVGHDGVHVWIRANGGGETDSVLFNHTHNGPQWFMREFTGKRVAIVAHTNWNNTVVTHHTIHLA